ncbi:MAG: FKBP-type peptidylprolyl isomerase [Bacteroidetes bacterium]|nr:MAG: FKBP-type peptidylprolyl isomerase [Bacteroidota bacterium]
MELIFLQKIYIRKLLACALAGSFLFSSCLKKDSGCSFTVDNAVAPQAEQQELKAYLDSAGITGVTKDNRGFFYTITSAGSGDTAKPCSQITVSYKGWLSNGKLFDQEGSAVFTSLGNLIDGWRQGIPLIRKGGSIKLYIPPSLGYGAKGVPDNNGNTIVPPNSITIFEISLISVQ